MNRTIAFMILIGQCLTGCHCSTESAKSIDMFGQESSESGDNNSPSIILKQFGKTVTLTGVAGYSNDKGSTPCLWVAGRVRGEHECVLVTIPEWDASLIGREITVVGKVSQHVALPDKRLQQRVTGGSELTEVRLLDGSSPKPGRGAFEGESFKYEWANLIMPDVNFHEEGLSNVVAVLNEFVAKSVTNVPPPSIRMALDPKRPITDETVFSPPGSQSLSAVTLTAKGVRVGDILKIIANLSGSVCEIHEHGAVFKGISEKENK